MKNLVCFVIISFFVVINIYGQGIDLTTYLPKNRVEDGTVDYTDYIQKGLDENKDVVFPPFPILINKSGLQLKSNMTLNFIKGSKLLMEPNAEKKYVLLKIHKVQNIVINNPTLVGDKDKHLGNQGQWGQGIEIRSSNNIKILNSDISYFWGDGIYITESSKDIFIERGVLHNNRRNGISLISGENITIKGVEINRTSGHSPMAGIDIEPNNINDILKNIIIEDVKTSHNRQGIAMVLYNFPASKSKNIDINIINFESVKDQYGIGIGHFRGTKSYKARTRPLRGKIKFKDINLIESVKQPFLLNKEKNHTLWPQFTIDNIKVISPAQRKINIKDVEASFQKMNISIKGLSSN